VIRGATPHFGYIANEVTKGIASLTLESEVPISFGVLITDTIEQAIEERGPKLGIKVLMQRCQPSKWPIS